MQILIHFCTRLRALLPVFIFLTAALLWTGTAMAQRSGGNPRADSATRARQQAAEAARIERQRVFDSAGAARTRVLDSARTSRQRVLDSARISRKTFTDSLTRIRKYRESRKYQDSVAKSRQLKIDASKAVRMAGLDSVRQIRKQSLDSASAIRNARLTQLKTAQKSRTDSLAAIRKYRESRRYTDSVAVVRKSVADSISERRQARVDSSKTARTAQLAAGQAERKRVMDSAMAVRKTFTDSLTARRKVRTDSLEKRKAERQKLAKEAEKKKKDKMQIKLQIAIKKKQEEYNNEKMLKKRWGFPRKPIQNLFTHYNYYYNADRKMDEAEANMQRVGKDNFEELIPLYSFDPDRDSTLLASDMDSVILKASLGIQIHDPRTKWSDDLYLLLGQANYYKGNYDQAQTAFRYIVGTRDRLKSDRQKKAEAADRRSNKTQVISVVQKEKTGVAGLIDHEAATNDALLWLARTLTQSRNYSEAEAVIDVLLTDPNLPEGLKGRLSLEQAFLALKKNNNREAASQLMVVTADHSIPANVRRRAAFLAGQLLQQQGRYADAAAQFDKVSDLNPKIDMDFYARKYKAMNLVAAGGDQSESIASLRRLLNDGKYAAYYEQIYFLLGQSAAVGGKRGDAINYLTKSTQSTKSTRKQKAVSFATLGHLYFADGNYDGAKLAYDSASRFASAAPGDSVVALAVRRASILESVATPSRTIRTQDSLLALAALSEREQRSVIRKYLRGLQQQRQDSIAAAQEAGVNSVLQQGGGTEAGSGNLSWYFSNATLMQQGYNDFRRKWGNRQLSDNWQRAAAVPIAGGSGIQPGGSGVDGSNAVDVNDEAAGLAGGSVNYDEYGLPTEAYLYGQIPTTAERQTASRQQIQSAYMSLGNAYVRQFEDYPRALATFDTFDARYPVRASADEETYLRYLVSLRQNNLSAANRYASALQQQYPDSRWAQQIRPSEDGNGMLTASSDQNTGAIYEEAYNLLQQRQYGEVLSRVRRAQAGADRRYSGGFTIMQAMALAGSANYDQADTVLSMYLQSNPSDSLRLWAETVQRYIAENRTVNAARMDSLQRQAGVTPGAASTNVAPVPGNPVAPALQPGTGPVTAPVSQNDTPSVYRYRPSEPHYFVFVFGAVESRVLGVKAALNDFNRLKFPSLTLSNSLEPVGPAQGLIFVKGFSNAAGSKSYLNTFKGTATLTREFNAGETQTVIISQSNYLKLMKDRNVPGYLAFYRANYR